MMIEEVKTVQRIILEKEFVAELANRQIEETRQELANIISASATAASSSTTEVFYLDTKVNIKGMFYFAQAYLRMVPRYLLLRLRLQL